eukprot:3304232-Pyramimonas_sp.AAC.2
MDVLLVRFVEKQRGPGKSAADLDAELDSYHDMESCLGRTDQAKAQDGLREGHVQRCAAFLQGLSRRSSKL